MEKKVNTNRNAIKSLRDLLNNNITTDEFGTTKRVLMQDELTNANLMLDELLLNTNYSSTNISKNVEHPSHYNTNNPIIYVHYKGEVIAVEIECIDVIRNMPTWKGNTIKYLWREGLKKDASLSDTEKEIEDLKKSIWYIQDKIKMLEDEANSNKTE